ncbi:MAG: hypothetical protein JST54_30875 [Deltaproteobacteria bacterium]|nr:hypothetical protein [Deltaproteobacteria bacterium]
MAEFPFQIEFVEPKAGYVICRELKRNRFRLAPGARLGDAEIKPHVAQPRALDAQGQPRVDLYVFSFANRADAKRFKAGDTVVLHADEEPRVLIPSP